MIELTMFGQGTKELNKIKEEISRAGALTVQMINLVEKAFFTADETLCDEVQTLEKELNFKDNLIEKHCIRYLALYAPKAKTLRSVIMYLEINHNLERVGDLCCGIAESIKKYNSKSSISTTELEYFKELFVQSTLILIGANKCVQNESEFEAMEVIKMDEQVDDLYYKITEKILQHFKKNPKHSTAIYELLKIVQRLERVGDQSTNVAEEMVYLVEGKVLRH